MPAKLKTITFEEIAKLFDKKFGALLTKEMLSYYIRRKEFPRSTGFGRPRVWPHQPVVKWIEAEAKKINA